MARRSRLPRSVSAGRRSRLRATAPPLSKVVRIGTVESGGRRASVYARISYDDAGKLSISGVIGPLLSGNALGGCGQIDTDFAHRNPADDDRRVSNPIKPEDIRFAPGWNREKWLDFLDAWHGYHLNDMHAGTPRQEAELKKYYASNPGMQESYDANVEHLRSVGLYEDGGYRYGTAWLKRSVPAQVVEFLRSLPDADKQPAWV